MNGLSIKVRKAPGTSSRKGRAFNVMSDTSEVMFFDTETTTDSSFSLVVGAWGMKNRARNLHRGFGLFIGESISDVDRRTVNAYARGFASRVDHVVARQVEIRADEIRRANAEAKPSKRKAPETLAYDIAEAGEAIRRGFAGMSAWVKANGGLPVHKRDAFAVMMLDAMRGTLPWGPELSPEGPCAIVGLNLRFDFGSIAAPWPEWTAATGHAPVMAWGRHDRNTDEKGFTYHLCACSDRVLHEPERAKFGNLSGTVRRASCPTHPAIVARNMGGRKENYGLSGGTTCGPILDIATIGRAVLGPGNNSLRGLGERLNASILKRTGETGHGKNLTFDYLDYLMCDIMATADIFELLMMRYGEHRVSKPVTTVFSEASVGKAHLEEFGIPGDFIYGREYVPLDGGPPVDVDEIKAIAQSSYQGARSEVMMRLIEDEKPNPIIHCDFRAQYSSLNVLLGMKSMILASRFGVIRGDPAIARARDVLRYADHAWLNIRANWPCMRIIVKVRNGGLWLPMKYDDPDHAGKTIYGMTYIDSADTTERWWPIMDLIASKLWMADGRLPEVLDAVELCGMDPIPTEARSMFGRPIDLTRDDLFAAIIEHRARVKASMKGHAEGSAEYVKLDNIQNNLKTTASSTSYGIFAETRMSGIEGEVMGNYYFPMISTHVTAGARLLLTIAQTLARDLGAAKLGTPIRHAMCDTDSSSFLQPEGTRYEDFAAVIAEVMAWFQRISPYNDDEPFFARELPKANDATTRAFFFGSSCKRYVMYTVESDRTIKLRKVSSHGLGHLQTDNDLAAKSNRDLFARAKDRTDDETDDGETEDDGSDDQGASLTAVPDPDRLDRWSADQARMWTYGIERALGWRKVEPGEAKVAGFPRAAWSMGILRRPVNVSTPSKSLEYAALGVRPGSFMLEIPTRTKTDLRIVAPMARHTNIIRAGRFLDKRTGTELSHAQVRKLETELCEGLRDYLSNPERKARSASGRTGTDQEAGYLSYHTRCFSSVKAVNRRGKTDDQNTLFDM